MNTLSLDTEKLEPLANENSISVKKPRGRGRPAKYTKEEREQKYKDASKQWRQEHSQEYKEHRKAYYEQHSEELMKLNYDYQARARNALRLLSELLEQDQLQVKDEKYKAMINDLIKNKKIIYA
jgi:hypothetical protein